jgi:hypothetical protein
MPADNVTATPVALPLEQTPTVDLEEMWRRFSAQVKRERDLFLSLVDERERLIGISPRTAEIRAWWRRQGSPPISDG